MHICHESNKTVTGPISARIVALYHQNRHLRACLQRQKYVCKVFHCWAKGGLSSQFRLARLAQSLVIYPTTLLLFESSFSCFLVFNSACFPNVCQKLSAIELSIYRIGYLEAISPDNLQKL